MGHKIDDWHKPRGPGLKLTASEILRLRKAFDAEVNSHDIARELQCSSRIANKYYAIFRGNTPAPAKPKKPKKTFVRRAEPTRAPLPNRFYTSNFEL